MTYIISLFLLISNLIFSFQKKNKKILAFFLMFFAWILFWGSTNNPDYHVYSNIYYSNAEYTTQNLEIGYIFLVKLANFVGLSYEIFLLFISLFGYFLIHSTVKRYSNNFNYIYLLYFIFPFFFDVVQPRNFLVMAILIYSTKFLIDNKKLKYCLIILIAGSIQMTAFAYLPLILINLKRKMILARLIAIFTIVGSLILLMNNKEIPLLGEISDLLQIDKLSIYLNTTTDYGFLLLWGLQIMSFIMMFLTKGIYNNYEGKSSKNNIKSKFINLVYWINVISFLYFPLYLINSNFSRVMRNIVFLNYIAFAITNDTIRDRKEKLLYILIVLFYVTILFVSQLLHYKDTIIKLILENNLLF